MISSTVRTRDTCSRALSADRLSSVAGRTRIGPPPGRLPALFAGPARPAPILLLCQTARFFRENLSGITPLLYVRLYCVVRFLLRTTTHRAPSPSSFRSSESKAQAAAGGSAAQAWAAREKEEPAKRSKREGQGCGCGCGGGGVPSDGEVHAQQVQGGRGRGGRRRRGHAGRRRPHEVQVRGGDRRWCREGRPEEEEGAGAGERGGGGACCRRRWWGRRKLLHPSAKPHAVHGTASAAAVGSDAGGGCWCRTAGCGARGRALALLQHSVVGGRRGPEQKPRLPLRRCGGWRGSRPGSLGEQLGERPRPREERDDAIEPGARRAQRSGVGSGGAQDYWPVFAGANVGCGADRATSTRDRGVLRGRRGGPGQALRFQVQLRLRPRCAPRRRPVRVDAGGQHLKRACGAR